MGFDFTSDLDDLGLSSQIEEITIDNEKKLIYEELQGTYCIDKAKLHNDRTISSKYDYDTYGRITRCDKAVITNSMIGSDGRCRWRYYGRPRITYIEDVKGLTKIENGDCAAMSHRIELMNNPDLTSVETTCRTAVIKNNPNLVNCSLHLSGETENLKYCGIELIGNKKLKKVAIINDPNVCALDLLFLANIRKDTKIYFKSFCKNEILQIGNSNIGFINGCIPVPKKFYIGKSTMEIQDFMWLIFHSEYIQIGLEDHVFSFENRLDSKPLNDALADAIHNNENDEDFFFIPEMDWTGSLDNPTGYEFTGEYRTTKDPKKAFANSYVKVTNYALFNSEVPILKVCPKKNQIKILV